MNKLYSKIVSLVIAIALTISAMPLANVSVKAETSVTISSISFEGKTNTVSWNECDGAVKYNVYRATGRYSKFTLLKTVEATSLKDTVTDSVYKYYYKVAAVNGSGQEIATSKEDSLELEIFGENMKIYSPSDDVNTINTQVLAISDKMESTRTAQFSSERYGLFFKAGKYNINEVRVGFYTQLSGLGKTPMDTIIPMANVRVTGSSSLVNFWRSMENIGVDTGSINKGVTWAASQAAPVRRVYVNGKLNFDEGGKSASGGFLADSYIKGRTGSSSQQQFFLRGNKMESGWSGGVWNIVFVGNENQPNNTKKWAEASYAPYTSIPETKDIKEKPFLFIDSDGEYKVFEPAVRKNAKTISWSKGNIGAGKVIGLDKFYVARADKDNADTINAALDAGKHLLLAPGIYEIDKPLHVKNANTIVLGLGYATLHCVNEEGAMKVDNVPGVTVAGILFDAGPTKSEYLLKVGTEKDDVDNSANPILLSDVFSRVGGAGSGKCTSTIIINSNDVICDHFWLWRADHGSEVGWTKNVSDNGVIVNGDDVTIYGLFVEHFQKYQTLWNGENGTMYFYQCELPYDVQKQENWMADDGATKGYAAYKVASTVKKHSCYGLGMYEVFKNVQGTLELENAMEVSATTHVVNACTVAFAGGGTINHIVNGNGDTIGKGFTQIGQRKGIDYYAEDGSTTDLIFKTDEPKKPSVQEDPVIPSRVKITKVLVSKKSVTISIKKAKYASKYQVQYATNKKFKKAKNITSKKLKITIKKKKFKKGKKYFFRVRGFRYEEGARINGRYSKIVSKKIK